MPTSILSMFGQEMSPVLGRDCSHQAAQAKATSIEGTESLPIDGNPAEPEKGPLSLLP